MQVTLIVTFGLWIAGDLFKPIGLAGRSLEQRCDVAKRTEVVKRKVLQRFKVKELTQLAKELRFLDRVNSQIRFDIPIQLDDLSRIARLFHHEVDQERFDELERRALSFVRLRGSNSASRNTILLSSRIVSSRIVSRRN